jgi:uncharacterized phiE125 gp8 family phage protein
MAVTHADHLLERVEGPGVSPVSLAEVKDHLRVTGTAEDGYIASLINAASSLIDGEGLLGRAVIAQKWAQSQQYPTGRVYLKMTPVLELNAVKYWNSSGVLITDTVGNYRLIANGEWAYVEPVAGQSWPSDAFDRPDAVRIEFTAGYGEDASSVPADLRHAYLLLIGHWYQHREAASDAKAETLPLGFDMLISAHRVSWYG